MRLSAKSLLIKDFLPPGAAGRLWCVNSADVLGVGVVLLAGGEDLGDVLHGPLRERPEGLPERLALSPKTPACPSARQRAPSLLASEQGAPFGSRWDMPDSS